MEYLDLYDENKQLTGEKIVRGKGKPIVPENNYIIVVLVFIQNSEGKFLIQKRRSRVCMLAINRWDSFFDER